MKIKNDLIRIEIGKKKYDFHNLILDEYLKRFVSSQINPNVHEDEEDGKKLNLCLIKFDGILTDAQGDPIQNNSEIYNQDFNLAILYDKVSQTINENQIVTQYTYSNRAMFDFNLNQQVYSLADYYNRNITAIGFNYTEEIIGKLTDTTILSINPWNEVCAVLDTSKQNIYLQENQDFSITRRDILTTDGIFYSRDKTKVPGPIHLAPSGGEQIIYQPKLVIPEWGTREAYNNTYALLYSIGFSSYPDYIDKELIIGTDVETENNGTELLIKGIEEYITKDTPLFPSEQIYPSTNLYPIKTNYKYIILKYKVYQVVQSVNDVGDIIKTKTDTGYYYYQAIEMHKFGKLNLKIKYERG